MGDLQATYNVRNNSNTTLKEVLDGEAVFVYDDPAHDDEIYIHQVSKGSRDSTKLTEIRFDFLQNILNQILPRNRRVTDYEMVEEDGIFDSDDEVALAEAKDKFWVGVNTSYIDASDTFLMLVKDYDKESQLGYWLDRVIDKETLVVTWLDSMDREMNDGGQVTDTGLLELYVNVVEPFVEGMISEANNYKDAKGFANTGNYWTPRTYPTDEAQSVSVSYCFGGKQRFMDFKSTVVSTQSDPRMQVSSDYKGNIDETTGDPDINIPAGTRRWSGLYSNELEEFSGNNMDQYNAFSYWAGIDCSGLTQRTVMAAKMLGIPGLNVEIPDLLERDNDKNGLDDGAMGSWQFDAPERVKTIPGILLSNEILKRGDLVFYSGKNCSCINHVAIVYCTPDDDPSGDCDGLSQGQYQIVHAYGIDQICYTDPLGGPQKCDFSRKVIQMDINDDIQSDTLKNPLGFGRIKLWD